MAFPIQGAKFPSNEWALAFDQYAENDAWFSGDQVALQSVYAGLAQGGKNRGDSDATHFNKGDGTRRKGGLRGILARMFNGQIVASDEQRTRIHAPVAANLAMLSADLLMAEPPTFRLLNTSGENAGKGYKGKAQDRADKILNGEDTHRTLSHAAELTAGISASVLTVHWDKNVDDKPWIGATSADAAIPEFIGGRLVAVNLYTSYEEQGAAGLVTGYLVHIERHEIGAIVHGLLRVGIDGKIGAMMPLETIESLAHIPTIPGSTYGAGDFALTVVLPTGIKTLTAAWWRNLPTKNFRKYGQLAMMGRADFEGNEQFLDAVDEVWSSWMRDIKIARARLIVPESFLEFQGPGLGGAFDTDRELLTALAYTDLGADQGMIQAHQFKIRAEEHASTLLALTKEITQNAGYSLSSYDTADGGSSKTATEVVDRTTLTERTRDKKFLYFAQAAQPLALAMMEIDALHFGGQSVPSDAELSIEIPELSQIDPEKQARQFQYLRTAMAVSTDTIVRELHPDWDDTQIEREVVLIQEENNLGAELDPNAERVNVDGPEEDPENPGFDLNGDPIKAEPPVPTSDPTKDPAKV